MQAQAETEVVFQQYKKDKPTNFDASSDVAMTVGDLQENLVAKLRPNAADSLGRGRLCAFNCVRQCGQPSAFPGNPAKERIRGRRSALGSASRDPDSPTTHRKRGDGSGEWWTWNFSGLFGGTKYLGAFRKQTCLRWLMYRWTCASLRLLWRFPC